MKTLFITICLILGLLSLPLITSQGCAPAKVRENREQPSASLPSVSPSSVNSPALSPEQTESITTAYSPSESTGEFTVENDTLEMPDGVNLSVTYYKPVPKEPGGKFPVLLEMNPYRKDDLCYMWNYPAGAYFARHGYVVARVDVRGTGSSEGVVPGREYSEQELSDGVEIINQLSKMEWSNGNVGMFGLSWSAFNSLMIAARKPPALKAIIIAHVSDDLYYQDVHFVDGVFHVDVWEAMMDSYNAMPAPPNYEFSKEYFANRFDQQPWHFTWKENQTDGSFWRKESTRFNPDVQVPIYVIGGLLDSYRDTVPRLLDTSNKNVKGEIGPWTHDWPNTGAPGPNYEWRAKAVRWWDYWLKNIDNGIMDEPRFMVFVRDGYPPSDNLKKLPGEWRCGDWPLSGIEMQRFYPGEKHNLENTAPSQGKGHTLAYKAGAGIGIETWWGDLTGDMADDDKYSLVYDSAPLKKPVEIIGFPKINLNISADATHYQWTARLEDVFPDGKVALVSGVLINPAHRESRLKPIPLVSGKPAKISGEIHYTTWKFKPGHKIRIAISNAQFPMAWPSPYKGKTTLFQGSDTWIELPVVVKNSLTGECDLPKPEEDEWATDASYEAGETPDHSVYHDPETGDSIYSCGEDDKHTTKNITIHKNENNTWKVNDNDPAHASYKAVTTYDVFVKDRKIRFLGIYEIKSDEKNFYLTVIRKATEDGEIIREKKWTKSIPRTNQ